MRSEIWTHTYAVNYIRTIFITPLLHLLDRTMDMGFDAFSHHSFPIRSLCHLPLEEGFVFAIGVCVHALSPHPTTASYSLILFSFPFIWLCRRVWTTLFLHPNTQNWFSGMELHFIDRSTNVFKSDSEFHRSQDFEHFSRHDFHYWVRVRCTSVTQHEPQPSNQVCGQCGSRRG